MKTFPHPINSHVTLIPSVAVKDTQGIELPGRNLLIQMWSVAQIARMDRSPRNGSPRRPGSPSAPECEARTHSNARFARSLHECGPTKNDSHLKAPRCRFQRMHFSPKEVSCCTTTLHTSRSPGAVCVRENYLQVSEKSEKTCREWTCSQTTRIGNFDNICLPSLPAR